MSNLPANLPSADDMALLGGPGVDLAAKYAAMQAMKEANTGGSGGSGFSTAGMVKIEVNKSGIFLFTNPHNGQSVSGKILTIITVNTEFQLQRWPLDNEVIEGYNPDTAKGPVCQSISYTDLTTGMLHNGGSFPLPAWSPYHAVKMLPDLMGSAGHDGKQGKIKCVDCPMAAQGAKGACKPSGMKKVIILAVGDNKLVDAAGNLQPVYGYMKLSTVNVIEYDKYLAELDKVYQIGMAELAITKVEANSVKDRGRVYARLSYHPIGKMNAQYAAVRNAAIEAGEKIVADAAEKAKAGGASAGAGGAQLGVGTPSTDDGIPF